MAENVYAMKIEKWRGWLDGYNVKHCLVKVGRTSREISDYRKYLERQFGVELVPHRAIQVVNGPWAERLLHKVLEPQKVLIENRHLDIVHREFYDLKIEQLNAAFDLLLTQDASDVRPPGTREKSGFGVVSRPQTRRRNRLSKRSDIPQGAQLTGTYDGRHYTCVVEVPGRRPKVKYKNKRGLSLTAAAKLINRYDSTNGAAFWWYGNVKLSDLRDA